MSLVIPFRTFPLEILIIGQHRHCNLLGHKLIGTLESFRAVRAYGITLYSKKVFDLLREGRVNTIFYDLEHSVVGLSSPVDFLKQIRTDFPNVVIVLMGSQNKINKLIKIDDRYSHYYKLILKNKTQDDYIIDNSEFDLIDLRSVLSQCAESHANLFEYDVAISFAGEDRRFARALSKELKALGNKVFLDEEMQPFLLGTDLYEYLHSVYSVRSRHCVMLISEAYSQKMWTIHERRAIYQRMLTQHGSYIFPIRIDDTKLPGFSESIAYLSKDIGAPKAAKIIHQRLWITTLDDKNGKSNISGST